MRCKLPEHPPCSGKHRETSTMCPVHSWGRHGGHNKNSIINRRSWMRHVNPIGAHRELSSVACSQSKQPQVPVRPGWSRFVPLAASSRFVPLCTGLSCFVPACPALSVFFPVCLDVSRFVSMCPGLSRFVPVCPGFVPVCPGVSRCELSRFVVVKGFRGLRGLGFEVAPRSKFHA